MNESWPECVDVVPYYVEIPFDCPMRVRETGVLADILSGMDSHALNRLLDSAARNDRYGRAVPRHLHGSYAVANHLGSFLFGGSITILGKRVFDPVPPHLVRQPAAAVLKKEKVLPDLEDFPEIPVAPPPEPKKAEKKEEKKPRVEAHVVEVPDMLFSLGSPVPALDDEGWLVGAVATAILYAKDEGAERQERLVVCGHADTTGEPARNYEIAEQRAQMVKALLDQNVDAWKTLANKHGNVCDYQRTLKSLAMSYGWNCDPGEVDNRNGPKTEGALKAFQQECNERFGMELKVDGIIGPNTWGALHRALCGLVCAQLEIEETVSAEPPIWMKPVYGYPDGKGIYSCGESFPVVAVDRDNVESQENRRVELVFAPKDLELKGAPSKNANMKAEECSLYDGERVRLVGVVVIRMAGSSVLGKVCMSFSDLLDQPVKGFSVRLQDGNGVLWSGVIDNSYLEVLDVPLGKFVLQVDVEDSSFEYNPA